MLLTYLLIVVALLLIPLVVLPNIASAINNLISMDWESASQAWITNLQQAAIQAANVPILGSSLENLLNSTAQLLQNASSQASSAPPVEVSLASAVGQFGKTLGLLVTLLGPIVSGTLALVFMLLISLQMSLASGEIRGWVMSIVPVRFKEEINALLDSILKIWMSFIGGQLTLMIVMGLLVWLLNVLLGTPQALLLGVISGLLEVIPSLGPLLAWIPAVILALLFGSSVFPEMDPLVFALVVSIGYFLVQSLENQLLVPSILGDAVDLPPLVVIIGVTIAGATLGVAGVFVATPLMSTGREIFQYLYTKLIDLGDQEPAPEPKPSIRDRLRSGIMRARQALRRKPKNLSPDLPS